MPEQPILSDAEQQRVYDLMREKLFDLFGPGGSFRITLGHATPEDAVFVSTVADTIAWDVTSSLTAERESTAKRAVEPTPDRSQNAVWQFVEQEMLRRRTNEDALPTLADRAA